MTTITKTTQDGRTVEITTHITYDTVWARATIDGKVVASGYPGVIPPIPGHPEYTHGLGRVALTADEFAAVTALIDTTRAEYDSSPEGAHARLVRQRERLVNEFWGRCDDARDDKAAAFDRGQLAEYFRSQHGDDETGIAQARAKLAVFDREHPEIVAELKADIRRRADNAIFD